MFPIKRAVVPAVRRVVAAAAAAGTKNMPVIARRGIAVSAVRYDKKVQTLADVKSEADLIPQGAAPGAVPTDLEQATGLERLELLGKMEGVDVFDQRPLDSSRTGTMSDPIIVPSFGDERYLGCTGCPADSHDVKWLTVSRDRPLERCPECGSVYKMEYVGQTEDHSHGHDHHHHGHEDIKTFADFIKPEYRYV